MNHKSGRSERIRTSDPLVPNEVRYQAALHSDNAAEIDRLLLVKERLITVRWQTDKAGLREIL